MNLKQLKFYHLLTAVCCLMALSFNLSSCTGNSNYESVKGDPMQTRIYTLDNGLKVYLTVNHDEPRIQTYIAVRTGSKNDPAESTGLAHYLEHLMFKGTNSFGTIPCSTASRRSMKSTARRRTRPSAAPSTTASTASATRPASSPSPTNTTS